MLKILYEDNHSIAVFKPAGLLVQGDASGDETLMDQVKAYLKEKYQKPGNVFLGLVHRLDRPASGIVVFARTSKGAARLSEQFRDRTVEKTYTALVEGQIKPPSGTLKHFLKKDEVAKKAYVVKSGTTDADLAELSYETIKSTAHCSLLSISLLTGRFHQIRAQLSAIGHPIIGDQKYGSKQKLPGGAIALCATSLTFTTATDHKKVSLSVPYPSEWNAFLK